MDVSPFWTSSEHFLVKIKLIITVILVKSIQILDVASIGVGIRKGEFYTMAFISEGKLENAL